VLARECIIADALPMSLPWPTTAEVELDGPTARIALTKEG